MPSASSAAAACCGWTPDFEQLQYRRVARRRPFSCGWTPDFEQLQYSRQIRHHAPRCGWTPDFEQLQLQMDETEITDVAAGLRILNSYNG